MARTSPRFDRPPESLIVLVHMIVVAADSRAVERTIMARGGREVGRGTVAVTSMFSLEPFTMKKLGSSQVFQTGEVYRQAPLIDYQPPHDLFMQLGVSYAWPIGSARAVVETDLVGSPSLGPTVFMHWPSAIENPQAPLSHHQMDSTHITPGVLRLGIEKSGVLAEASWFRGLEPDENRTDFDVAALDSYALRVSWTRGPWQAQVSGGHLRGPEWVEPDHPGLTTCLPAIGPRTKLPPTSTEHFRFLRLPPNRLRQGYGESRERVGVGLREP